MTLQTILEKLRIKEKEPAVENAGIAKAFAPYEDIDGKKTTKLGLFFVVIMVIAGIWQGQNLLSSIRIGVWPPERLSKCFSYAAKQSGIGIKLDKYYSTYFYSSHVPYVFIQLIVHRIDEYLLKYSNWSSELYTQYPIGDYPSEYGNWPSCRYSPPERKNHFDTLYESLSPKFVEINDLSKSMLPDEIELITQNRLKMRGVGYDNSIKLDNLEAVISKKKAKVEELTLEIRNVFISASSTLQSVADGYENEVTWIEFKRFAITFILFALLVGFALRKYLKAKNNQSEFSIIWLGFVTLFCILLAEAVIVFIDTLLPELSDKLITALAEFPRSLF